MLRIAISVLVYLIVGLPVGWLFWHYSAGWPLAARLSLLLALVLGMIDGRRRRLQRRRETFRDFVG
jgi:F0F1-type ATP synthase assembly protein I